MSTHRAVITAATGHQLLMAQAVASVTADQYRDILILWYGAGPLDGLRSLIVERRDGLVYADCRDLRRCKLWRSGGRALRDRVRHRLWGVLGPRSVGSTDVYIGNDGALFNQLTREACGADWDHTVLYEEGVGLYYGSRKYLEKTLTNLLLVARGMPYRMPWRDFSRNRRLRRIACNHPSLLARTDVEVRDLGSAYLAILRRAAAAADGVRAAIRAAVPAVYISGSYSEARHMSQEVELELLARVFGAVTDAGARELQIKFHPLDSEAKRRRILDLGFVECPVAGPFEMDCLRRRYGHIFSFRSSVLLNLALVLPPESSHVWVLRGDGAAARRLSRGPLAELTDRLVHQHPNFRYFDLDAPPQLTAAGQLGAGLEVSA